MNKPIILEAKKLQNVKKDDRKFYFRKVFN